MLPSGWKKHNLSEVVKVIDCKHRTPEYVESGIPLISPGTIKWGSLDTESPNKRVSFSEYQSLMDHCSIDIDDLVMSRNQSVGVVSYVSSLAPFVLGQDTVLLKPEQAQGKYIFYKLQSESVQKLIAKLAGGSTFSRINLSDIKKIKIDIPPLPEQKKIAQILSTWDKAITTTEQLIANSQQQKKALMQQLLTGKKRLLDDNGVRFSGEWEKVKLKDVCQIKTGKKDVNEGNPDGKYAFFTCANEPTKSDSYSYDCEALLIAGNGILGKTHYYNGKFEAYQRTYILSDFLKELNVQYLHQFILYWLLRDIEREKQHGAMPYIKLGLLQNFIVFFPSKDEQQKIASVLSSADQEIELLQSKLTALKQEKKALMQQLLTGKRRVKVG